MSEVVLKELYQYNKPHTGFKPNGYTKVKKIRKNKDLLKSKEEYTLDNGSKLIIINNNIDSYGGFLLIKVLVEKGKGFEFIIHPNINGDLCIKDEPSFIGEVDRRNIYTISDRGILISIPYDINIKLIDVYLHQIEFTNLLEGVK